MALYTTVLSYTYRTYHRVFVTSFVLEPGCRSWYIEAEIDIYLYIWILGNKTICVFPITRPTHNSFADRLSFFLCDSQFVYWGSYRKKEVNRTTLREVMGSWRHNFYQISAKMDTFLIFEDKSHSRDNTKNIAKILNPDLPTRFWAPCDRKHTYFCLALVPVVLDLVKDEDMEDWTYTSITMLGRIQDVSIYKFNIKQF